MTGSVEPFQERLNSRSKGEFRGSVLLVFFPAFMRGFFRSCPVALLPIAAFLLAEAGLHVARAAIVPTSNQLGSVTISLTVSDGTLTASNSFLLAVNPASLAVTANSASRRHGATNPVLTGSVVGLQAGDNITASFSTTANTNSPVGNYPVAVTLSDPGGKLGNYVVTTNNGTLTVTNALLTVAAAADGSGAFEFVDEGAGVFNARYYRIAMS